MGKASRERMTGLSYEKRVLRAQTRNGYTSVTHRLRQLKDKIAFEMAVYFGRAKQ